MFIVYYTMGLIVMQLQFCVCPVHVADKFDVDSPVFQYIIKYEPKAFVCQTKLLSFFDVATTTLFPVLNMFSDKCEFYIISLSPFYLEVGL